MSPPNSRISDSGFQIWNAKKSLEQQKKLYTDLLKEHDCHSSAVEAGQAAHQFWLKHGRSLGVGPEVHESVYIELVGRGEGKFVCNVLERVAHMLRRWPPVSDTTALQLAKAVLWFATPYIQAFHSKGETRPQDRQFLVHQIPVSIFSILCLFDKGSLRNSLDYIFKQYGKLQRTKAAKKTFEVLYEVENMFTEMLPAELSLEQFLNSFNPHKLSAQLEHDRIVRLTSAAKAVFKEVQKMVKVLEKFLDTWWHTSAETQEELQEADCFITIGFIYSTASMILCATLRQVTREEGANVAILQSPIEFQKSLSEIVRLANETSILALEITKVLRLKQFTLMKWIYKVNPQQEQLMACVLNATNS